MLLLDEEPLANAELQIRYPTKPRIVGANIVRPPAHHIVCECSDLVSWFSGNAVIAKRDCNGHERAFGAMAGRQGGGGRGWDTLPATREPVRTSGKWQFFLKLP